LIGTTDETKIPQEELIIMEDFEASAKEVEDIVAGILYGAVDAEGLENIEGCIKDTDAFFKDILSAVKDFEKKTPAGMADGIKKLGDAVLEIKDDIAECEGVEADVEKLEKMLVIFSNPTTFFYHLGKDLLINGVQIYKEIDDSVSKFEEASYFEFGEDVGDALALLIFGVPYEMLDIAEDTSIPALAVEPYQMYIF
jgi:hypothetical protein